MSRQDLATFVSTLISHIFYELRLLRKSVLRDICASMHQWTKLNWIQAILRQEDIADRIMDYHTKIDSLRDNYQVGYFLLGVL